MSLPPPELDDRSLAARCLSSEHDAFRLFEDRFERLIESVAVRVLDEQRSGQLEQLPSCVDAVIGHLRQSRAAPLRAWDEECSLRHYLGVVTRQVCLGHLQDVTPPASVLSLLPAPATLFLAQVDVGEAPRLVMGALGRMSPNIVALVRLRLRGVDRGTIGATLGIPGPTVTSNLERMAERLGVLLEADTEDAVSAFRVVLDAAPVGERVRTAVRTREDAAFRDTRALVETTWRGVRDAALRELHPKQAGCLDDNAIAGFVGGSLKGTERTRAEGHVTVCARCIDTVATLGMDLRTADAARDRALVDTRLAVAAACVATGRHRAGAALAESLLRDDEPRAGWILRLARVGMALVGGPMLEPAPEPSRVVQTRLPSDEEAPIVALEALLRDDAHSALRAIDDELARGTIGTRIRLLSRLSDENPEPGRQMAREFLERSHSDPGLLTDAEAGAALQEGEPLPREILVERIRDVLPSAIRYVLKP